MIYFDHNATTPVDPRVVEAMLPYLSTFYGNPSSLHRHGRAVRTAVEHARDQVAQLVGAHPSQVVFTSGGTEANNLVLNALRQSEAPAKILIGATEHPAMVEPAEAMMMNGWSVERIPVDHQGLIDLDALSDMVTSDVRLVSVMLANNETGVIQDVAGLAGVLAERDLLLHTDAVQAAGKMETSFSDLGVHLMSLSAHKIYGPKGVGALIFDKRVDLPPMQRGGEQEWGIRAGTENVAGIIGFGRAAELAKQELSDRTTKLLEIRQQLESRLHDLEGVSVVAEDVMRLPNTLQILCPGTDGEMMLMQLDQKGIAVSSGSACASQNRAPSPVLTAMGYGRDDALSALRISLGQQNSAQDVDAFVTALDQILAAFKAS